MEDKIELLKNWVKQNYSPTKCGWTYERSEGNSYDCFDDGDQFGLSWAAYEVGCILEMELTAPDETEDDEYGEEEFDDDEEE